MRDAAGRQQPRINAGRGDDEQDLRDEERGAHQDLPEAEDVDLAVDEHGHKQRIDDGDAGGLGRREHAAIDAAEDHGERADRPARLLGRLPDRLPARFGAERNAFHPGIAHDEGGIDDADEKARQDAGGEQLHGGLLRRDRVKDHRDRRRDDDGDRARGGDQAHGKALVVAALLERGIDHPAHGDDGADGGVRHRAEQFGRRHRGHRERAAHAADDGHDHGDDAPRDAALRHDLAGEHEERHREQRKIVEAAEHVGLDRVGRDVGDGQHRDDRGHQQDEKDRETQR